MTGGRTSAPPERLTTPTVEAKRSGVDLGEMHSLMTLRVGLLGYGRVARLVHLGVLASLPEVELTAVAELDPFRRREALQRVPGAQGHADWSEAVARPDVDAVVVCLPSGLHAEVALAALAAGKHLYLEKPLATEAAAAERVLGAWRAARTVAMMGFNYRANALVGAARAHIRSGRIGEVRGISTVFTAAGRELPRVEAPPRERRRRAPGQGFA